MLFFQQIIIIFLLLSCNILHADVINSDYNSADIDYEIDNDNEMDDDGDEEDDDENLKNHKEQVFDITKVYDHDAVTIGDENAPITMIVYDSITCHHCAEFNKETFHQIRKIYIDAGKVRVVMRDFPLDAIALRLSAMLKCFESDFDLYQKLRIELFKTQRQWIFQKNDEKRLETAKNILSFANLDRKKMDQCMIDENNINFVMKSRQNAIKGGLNATPMFIINGVIYEGLRSYSFFANKFEAILENT